MSQDAESLVWLIKFLEFVLVKSYQAQINDETGVLVDADSIVAATNNSKKQPARKARNAKKPAAATSYVVSTRIPKAGKAKSQSLDSDGENENALDLAAFPLIQSIAIYRDHILPLMESQRAGMKFLVELMTQAYVEIMTQNPDSKLVLEAMFEAKNAPLAEYVKNFNDRKKKLIAIDIDLIKLQKEYLWDMFVEQLRDIVNLADYDEELEDEIVEVKVGEKTKKAMADLMQGMDIKEESEDEWPPVKPQQLVQSLSDRQVLSIAHPGALMKAGIQIESPNVEQPQAAPVVEKTKSPTGILKRSIEVAQEPVNPSPRVAVNTAIVAQNTPLQLRGNQIPGFTPGRVDQPFVDEQQHDGVDRHQFVVSGQQDSMESLPVQNENVVADHNVTTGEVTRVVIDGEERFINHSKRRKKIMWTQEEVDLLEEGMKLYGCKWTKIRDWANTERVGFPEHRTAPDLKDKARVERNRRLKYGEALGIFALMNTVPDPASAAASVSPMPEQQLPADIQA